VVIELRNETLVHRTHDADARVVLETDALLLLAVRRLAATPNERILEAAKTAGTLFDSAYGMEPSFVTEMVERRYWARRTLTSRRLWRRVPVLVAQDLLLLRRRPRRVLWAAGATALPALLAHAPGWLLGVAVLLGGLLAGGVTAGTIRTDAGNPVLLRGTLAPIELPEAWASLAGAVVAIGAVRAGHFHPAVPAGTPAREPAGSQWFPRAVERGSKGGPPSMSRLVCPHLTHFSTATSCRSSISDYLEIRSENGHDGEPTQVPSRYFTGR